MISASAGLPRRFEFGRDTFAYANELVWDYAAAPESPALVARRGATPRTYTHRCFVMARAARQFFYHARFDAALPTATAAEYGRLVRAVVARNPRIPCAPPDRIVIPGYESLNAFSQAEAPSLMAHCGGAWQSYVQRSHWRMVFPVSRRHQAGMAAQLVQSLATRRAAIVHVFRFPQLTINHAVVLYDQVATGANLRFAVYDPNSPARPTELTYDAASRTFDLPRNHYWGGGRVDVLETVCSWFY